MASSETISLTFTTFCSLTLFLHICSLFGAVLAALDYFAEAFFGVVGLITVFETFFEIYFGLFLVAGFLAGAFLEAEELYRVI